MSSSEIVATLVASDGVKLSPDLLEALASSVDATNSSWLDKGIAADIFCKNITPDDLTAQIRAKLGDKPFDVLVQPSVTRRKKILVADMESTMIEQEMLDELADIVGIRDKVRDITWRTMNGDLDFAEALRERVSLLKGQNVSILVQAAQDITYTAGAAELVATMRANGAQCWLVSGGFTCFSDLVAKHLGFDKAHANEMILRDGKIVGEVAEPILDKDSKKAWLQKACADLNVTLSDAVSVGDGANDVPMLATNNKAGGLGVAFQAKPNVRAAITPQINYGDLTALLYAQGYKREDFISSSRM